MILVVGGLVLGILAALYLALATHSSVQFKDSSFNIISPTHANTVVEITKNAEDTVQCSVRAMNESYAIVGWKTLVVGPSEGKGPTTRSYDVDLRTESLATTAGVEECRVLKDS